MNGVKRALISLVAAAALLAGCASLPVYNPVLPPLPAASLRADEIVALPDGTPIPLREWLPASPPSAVILALHGFNDSRDAWEIPAPVFAQAGIALFAPDQRGFGATSTRGRWPGADALVNDAAALLRLLHTRYPGTKLYAMGESMGGAVLMDLATSAHPPAVDGWILLSPAVWGRRQMGPVLSSSLWLASSVLPGLSVTGGEVKLKITASDNRDALLRLARDPLTIRRTRFDTLRGLTDLMDEAQDAASRLPPNTLILTGEKDAIVPVDATARAWRKLPAKVRRALYPNGYHLLTRDKGRADVIADVIAWIRDPGAPLPSGADRWAQLWLAWRDQE